MARFTVTVDLPTPPLPEDTPMTRVLESAARKTGRGSAGRVPVPTVAMPVPVVVRLEVLGLGDAEHVGPQSPAQRRALLLVHDDELEPDLLHAGNGQGHPVDLVGQFVGARPGSHGEGDVDEHPPAAWAHQAHEVEIAQGPAQLGIDDRADRGLELQFDRLPCTPSSRVGSGPGRARSFPRHPG